MAIEIRNMKPKNDESNVPIMANIEFDIVSTDDDVIDISTMTVTIESISLITEETVSNIYSVTDVNVIQYKGNQSYTNQGPQGFYRVFVNPEGPFEQGMTVTVKINVSTYELTPEEMEEYEVTFSTVYNDLISDFTYAIIYQAQTIPVYNEILRPNSSTAPNSFDSAFKNWNMKPNVEIKKNQVVITDGFSIDYSNGRVVFDDALEYNDQIEASYTFRLISDDQIQAYFKQAAAIWRLMPASGGPVSIYSADITTRSILFIGAAVFAFNDLIFALAIQEKRVIFDNRSWDEAWKTVIDMFKSLRDSYKEMWEKALEAKKFKLPRIAAIVTPDITLPGGRSRFFRYLYKDGGGGL